MTITFPNTPIKDIILYFLMTSDERCFVKSHQVANKFLTNSLHVLQTHNHTHKKRFHYIPFLVICLTYSSSFKPGYEKKIMHYTLLNAIVKNIFFSDPLFQHDFTAFMNLNFI